MTIQRSEPPVLSPAPEPERANASGSPDRDVAEIGVRLLDDAYMTWLIAESEAEQALEGWRERSSGTRESRYRAYLAAIEREEAASRDLQRLHEIAASYPRRSQPAWSSTATGAEI